ncbi:MAG: RNA methyltransferase [Inhella sp.]|jgi:TrmH family RNA methyltransferase|uniref:TrmH family RNA methyltransferase n=1 Tax=Inhella sp. TaxID=1921806 RepID=UPI0022CB2C14|nr:RNA methyltransferase [Inhella sp.]MCZ8234656.1 RNA methyltransferase [Inhella sp.]
MTVPRVERISATGNPTLKALRTLAQDNGAYRTQGRVWLEGDHLLRAAAERGQPFELAVITEEAINLNAEWRELVLRAPRVLVVSAKAFESLSGLASAAQVAAVMRLPAPPALQARAASVVLDRLQDAGNVGAILRSAAAFGVRQVLALKGTAALWSPKVLRAGMGAHFGLSLVEGLDAAPVLALGLPLVATSSHATASLPTAPLPQPCAWVLGHEGQGVSESLLAGCALTVGIPQPGGEESLNVAAAAAICFYETARRGLG